MAEGNRSMERPITARVITHDLYDAVLLTLMA